MNNTATPTATSLAAESVIAKNNLAAIALENGRHGEALRLMRDATLKLNDWSTQSPQEDQTAATIATRKHEDRQEIKTAFPLKSCPVGLPVAHEAGGQEYAVIRAAEDPDEACPTMYRRSILLSWQEVNMPVVAAVVLYNLALCEHLLGTRFNSPQRIASALKFYKCAYQLIEDNREASSFGDLLILAVINNIADCAAQSLENTTSQRWFDFLGRVLGTATTHAFGGEDDQDAEQNDVEEGDTDRRILPTLDEDDYLFFSVNALLFQGSVLISAPAA